MACLLRNANDLYDLVTVKELQEWTDRRILYRPSSKIDWKSLITSQLGLSLASGETEGDITGDTPVVVTHWAFLENLMNLIDKTSPRVLGMSLGPFINILFPENNINITNNNKYSGPSQPTTSFGEWSTNSVAT